MTHDGTTTTPPVSGDTTRDEPAVVVPQAPNLSVPQGVGPRAISQWPIMQRLTAEEWKLVMQALPGRVGARARHGGNARRFIEAVLWVAQTGAYWSDLPRDYGSWHGIYVRFIRWSQDGNWNEVLARFDPKDQRAEVSEASALGPSHAPR